LLVQCGQVSSFKTDFDFLHGRFRGWTRLDALVSLALSDRLTNLTSYIK
jgi:hypothetical protein